MPVFKYKYLIMLEEKEQKDDTYDDEVWFYFAFKD